MQCTHPLFVQVLELQSGLPERWCTMEPLLDGNYRKHNDRAWMALREGSHSCQERRRSDMVCLLPWLALHYNTATRPAVLDVM